MAGDWLKMRHDLPDDPAVLQLAAACDIRRQHVVGCLHAVWSWFDRHTAGGKAKGIDESFIDELAGVSGFAKNLEKVGWLRVTSTGVSVPRFNRHISQSAKRRALTARRVAEHRKRTCNAGSVTDSLPENRTTESEKRKQEKRTEHSAADAPKSPTKRRDQRRSRTVLLGNMLSENADAAAGGTNQGQTVVEIQTLLGERGCDVSLRGVVARLGDVRVVRKVAAEYDKNKSRIQNPGGWWRDQLRRAGLKCV